MRTTIYLTFPHCDDGIEERVVDAVWPHGFKQFHEWGGWTSITGLGPNHMHLTRGTAVEAAREFRAKRIAEAAATIAKLSTLPAIV
jgi:predicted class III extradiol MEMO1 family dioxygenase